MTISHAAHDHPATSAARATCRRDMAQASDLIQLTNFIKVMDSGYCPTPNHWTFSAARRFAGYQGQDLHEAARAALAYFASSGDEATDRRRIANGYIITTDAHTIRSITLRSAS